MRTLIALVFAFAATPALADLQCEMQHGRLVCDYSAALADAVAQGASEDPAITDAVPVAYAENPYDTSEVPPVTAEICAATGGTAEVGC